MGSLKYASQVIRHKWFVLIAGIRIGGIPFWRLIIHDWSKFSPLEFKAYKKKYIFGNCPDNEWRAAWLHHLHRNPHHHGHWLLKNEPLEMPTIFAREMIADWLGAGKQYAGSWDIKEWVGKNIGEMRLHQNTREYVLKTLKQHHLI